MNVQKVLIPTRVRATDRKIKKTVCGAEKYTKEAQYTIKDKTSKAIVCNVAKTLTFIKENMVKN